MCQIGSSTPGSRALRFDLPDGTDLLTIEPKSSRPVRVSDDNNWHLAQGVVVVEAETFELVAARVEIYGTTPRAAVVSAGGVAEVREGVAAPDGPFYHQTGAAVPGLVGGSYYVVGFGSDGGGSTPNEWWQYDVRLGGRHRCVPVGSGHVFDIDNTEFSSGSQIYAPGAGVAEGIRYSFTAEEDADLIVGLMDAAVQGPGEASLRYATPLGSGIVDDTIVPFVSRSGEHAFEATFSGAFPQIAIVGAAIDLS